MSFFAPDPFGVWDTRWFRGSCPAGRLSVDYAAGKRFTVRSGGRLIASLTPKDGFIGCADAALREPRGASGFWDPGWYIWGVRWVKHSVKLTCVTKGRLRIDIVPSYDLGELVGGLIYISTPPLHFGSPETALIASFEEGGKSNLNYRPKRCRFTA